MEFKLFWECKEGVKLLFTTILCWLSFMPNLSVILFNHFSLYFMWDFIVRVVCKREREDSSSY